MPRTTRRASPLSVKWVPLTLLVLILGAASVGCLAGRPSQQTPTAAKSPATTVVRSPVPTRLPSSTPTHAATATPAKAPTVLAVPAEFADERSAALAGLQQAQPALRVERVGDSAAAQARAQERKASWAVIHGPMPFSSARLLCLTPYVPVVHYTSPLDEMTSERLREVYQGKNWTGPVLRSGDESLLRSLLGMGRVSFGPQTTALPNWKAVVDRVAGDRAAIAFVPWADVDARVKVLDFNGKSIAVDGVKGYGQGDGWWLLTGGAAPAQMTEEIARALACPLREPATFLAAGDMLMGWFVHEIYIKKEGPEYLFRRIRDLIASADIAFANFESPISSRGVMENKGLMFRAPPEAVKGLTYAGIDVVNLANNHFGDYGAQAMLDTFDILRQNGVGYVGAGRNRNEARSPWITTTQGIKVAILAYNEIEPGFFSATASRPGTAWIEPDNVYAEIRAAKTQADIVIASFHWGIEYTVHPNARQQELARRSAEAGASLIVGHHPHVVQGIGFAGNVYINYSIGDFVYSQPTRPATGEGIILRAVLDGSVVRQVQMIPIYIDRAQPYVISPVEAKLMMARIFDAARLYRGLPPTSEQATAAAPARLATASSAAEPGSLAFVELKGLQAELMANGRGGLTRLTAQGALNDAPAWSPDGKMLAFSSARDGTVDIFVQATGSADPVNLTRHAAWDDYPAWSPDGSRLVFSSNRDGPFKLYIMNADGGGVRRLTDGQSWDTTPAWSPDGKRIAFASDRGGTFQVYTIGVDGGDLRQITREAENPRLNAWPSWSPDGSRIVYQSYQDESLTRGDDSVQDRDYEIMVVASQGGKAQRLTDNAFADIQPVWSPDGKRIAFASDRSGVFQIYVMSADGGNVGAVTGGAAAHLAPAWAP